MPLTHLENYSEIGKFLSRLLNGTELFLASSSPRRKEILSWTGVPFKIKVPNHSETTVGVQYIEPLRLVQKNSLKKVESVSSQIQSGIILGADTIVVLNNEILGKPKDEAEAYLMLKKLNGKWHTVYSGVAMLNKKNLKKVNGYESTQVKFHSLSDEQILKYVATKDPLDKAGAYGIQSQGSFLVEKLKGNFDNVMGLPLNKVKELITKIL